MSRSPHVRNPSASLRFLAWHSPNLVEAWGEAIRAIIRDGNSGRRCGLTDALSFKNTQGFKIAQLRRILAILESQQYAIQEAWKNHFQG
jgi:hypothetical protein